MRRCLALGIVGSGVLYFFDPEHGAARRGRFAAAARRVVADAARLARDFFFGPEGAAEGGLAATPTFAPEIGSEQESSLAADLRWTDAEPVEAEAEPGGAEAELRGTEAEPGGAEAELRGAEAGLHEVEPFGAEAGLDEVEAEPVGAEAEPVGAEAGLHETEPDRGGTEAEPPGFRSPEPVAPATPAAAWTPAASVQAGSQAAMRSGAPPLPPPLPPEIVEEPSVDESRGAGWYREPESAARSREVVAGARNLRLLKASLVLALVLAAGAGALAAWSLLRHDSNARKPAPSGNIPSRQAQADAILARADARRIPVLGSRGKVVLVVTPNGQAVLLVSGLKAAPTGKTYEAWVIRGKRPKPAGLFRGGGEQVLLLERRVLKGAIVALSLEPGGGSSMPTTEPLYFVKRT